MNDEITYDNFLTKIYNYSPYFGKERYEKDYATDFYLLALDNVKGKILEFGTCTGMLTIPLAKAGYQVDSVDISPYMHEYVNALIEEADEDIKEKIRLITCNAFDFLSEEKYAGIVMPDSFLLAQADKRKQKELLKKCCSLLPVGGVLVFDVFKPWDKMIETGGGTQCTRIRLPKGETYIVHTKHLIDAEQQRHTFEFEHVPYKENIKYKHNVTYRYMRKQEIENLLNECGFGIHMFDDNFNYGIYYSVIAYKRQERYLVT